MAFGGLAMPYCYRATARCFHWVTVVLVIVLGGLGVWMTSFEPKDEAFKDLLYHTRPHNE
jgi:cytochrome b561